MQSNIELLFSLSMRDSQRMDGAFHIRNLECGEINRLHR